MMQDRQHSIQKRHLDRQRQRRKQQLRRRIISVSLLSAIVICIVVFLTPLFNIRAINTEGNSKVSTEELSQALSSFLGDNILTTSAKDAKKALASFSYIEAVKVKKSFFPPSVTVIVTEGKPAVYMMHQKSFVVIDKDGKILEVASQKPECTEVTGLRLTSANEGETLSLYDNAKLKTVLGILNSFERSGLLSGVTKINLENLDSISFNYQSRLDAFCGPYVDFDRKLGLFREAVNSASFTENTRGTLDMTKTGKAVYTP